MYRLRPGPQKKESKLSRMVRSVVHSLFVGDTRLRGKRPFVQRIFHWLHAFHFSGTFRSRAATFCSLPGMMLPCGQFTVSMVVVIDLIGQQAMSRSLTGSTLANRGSLGQDGTLHFCAVYKTRGKHAAVAGETFAGHISPRSMTKRKRPAIAP